MRCSARVIRHFTVAAWGHQLADVGSWRPFLALHRPPSGTAAGNGQPQPANPAHWGGHCFRIAEFCPNNPRSCSLCPGQASVLYRPTPASPPRWVNVAAISAAVAKDVRERAYVDDRTQAERSRPGQMAKAAAKANKSTPFNAFPFERMAG